MSSETVFDCWTNSSCLIVVYYEHCCTTLHFRLEQLEFESFYEMERTTDSQNTSAYALETIRANIQGRPVHGVGQQR